MTNENFSRRKLLERSLQLPLGGVLLATAATVQTAQAADTVCADMAKLPGDQRGLRESLKYVEKSPNPATTCGVCGLFEGAAANGCGNCMIFSGPANAGGHCESWSPKS